MIYQALPTDKVIYGQDVVMKHLVNEMKNNGAKKILFVTTNSLLQSQSYKNLLKACSEYEILTRITKQHIPSNVLFDGIDELISFSPDLIISLGGGSAIDGAKIFSLILSEKILSIENLIQYTVKVNGSSLQLNHSPVKHFAIPTTLSAAEFSGTAGFSYDEKKNAIAHLSIVPDQIYLDPEYTLDTPMDLWASTGMKAVDHAVETIYSPIRQPVNSALALQSLKYLFDNLPLSVKEPTNLNNRLNCQIGAWLSSFSKVNIRVGLSHMIGHQLGTYYDIPHGITSAIMLPHVMTFLSELTSPEQAQIYDILHPGNDSFTQQEKANEASELVHDLIRRLNIPHHLRDFDVEQNSLQQVAKNILWELKARDNQMLLDLPNLEDQLHQLLIKAY